MDNRSVKLITFRSDYIVRYISEHPISWANLGLANYRGCPADQAGCPPTPSVHEFLAMLGEQQDLFTQDEFVDHCEWQWYDWLQTKNEQQRLGVLAKQRCNFYPSMIDSLHAWALLSESGWFDICVIDSYADALSKVDLTLVSPYSTVKVALLGPKEQASIWRSYKLNCRAGTDDAHAIAVKMPENRPRNPGNKRWYQIEDFGHLHPYATPIAERLN